MQRPLYMTAKDAISYGIIDRVVERDSKAIADVMSADAWDSAAGLVQKSMWIFRSGHMHAHFHELLSALVT